MNFYPNFDSLKQDYLDVFEGINPDITYTAKYDNNCDIGKSKKRRKMSKEEIIQYL